MQLYADWYVADGVSSNDDLKIDGKFGGMMELHFDVGNLEFKDEVGKEDGCDMDFMISVVRMNLKLRKTGWNPSP